MGFGNFLKQRGHWKTNPLKDIPIPRAKAKDRGPGPRAFTTDEVRRLIARAQAMEAATKTAGKYGANRSTLYLFLAHTGLRYGEACRLRWKNIDLEAGTLQVREDKAGRGDWIPLHPEVVEALRSLRREGKGPSGARRNREHGDVFWAVSKNTLVGDMDAANVPRSVDGKSGQWHCFRKLSVTERLRAGAKPTDVQRLARHKNLELTLGTYNQLEVEELRAAVEAIPTLLAGKSENGLLSGRGKSDSLPPASHAEHLTQSQHDAPRPGPAVRDSLSNLRDGGRPVVMGTPAANELRNTDTNGAVGNRTPVSVSPTVELLEHVVGILSVTLRLIRGPDRGLSNEHEHEQRNAQD